MSAESIIENSRVKLATAAAVALFLVGGAFNVTRWMQADALWKQNQEHEMEKLTILVSGKIGDRWTSKQMRLWARQLRDSNAELVVPSVDSIPEVE